MRTIDPIVGPYLVDWANPINEKMVLAWMPEQPLLNIATGVAITLVVTGSVLQGVNSAGLGWQGPGTAARAETRCANFGILSDKSEFTILSYGSGIFNGSATQSIVEFGDNTGSSGNYVIYGLGGSSDFLDTRYYDTAYRSQSATIPGASANGARVLIGLNSVVQSRRESWVDGQLVTSGTAIALGSGNNSFMTLFGASNGSSTGVIYPQNLVRIWNRPLLADECVRLSLRPKLGFKSSVSRAASSLGTSPSGSRPSLFYSM